MKVNREELLKQLESILPGLSTKEIIEQSNSFIFKDKYIYTYNDEIACSHKSALKIEGAIPATSFVSILRKLKEDEIDIEANEKNSQLSIKCKQKRVGLNMDKEILLPIDAIEKPKKWKKLPDDFAEAVGFVKDCAGSNDTEFTMTCVHISSKYIEACNNYQAARFKMKTNVENSVLVRKESLKHIVSLDMSEFSETKNWIHFRNAEGLILSCRYYLEDYPSKDITGILKVDGKSFSLPKGLKESIDKAEIFSSENPDSSDVTVRLKKGKFKVIGKGILGFYSEVKKSKYNGVAMQFTIPPKILVELAQNSEECVITENRLKMKLGKFEYVTVVGKESD